MDIFPTAFALITSGDADLWRVVALSLQVSLSATVIAAFFSIILAAFLSVREFTGKRAILVISTSLMALPPVVAGLAIYLLLSRSGPLGSWGLLFTPTAMVIAQTVLIFPIILSLTYEAISPLHRDYKGLFAELNVTQSLQIRTLILDARFAISVAVLAGFGRALAEVGAVIMVGGNINGVTRVMTTTIALETSKGNLQLALALGLILVSIALGINIVTQTLARVGRKYQVVR